MYTDTVSLVVIAWLVWLVWRAYTAAAARIALVEEDSMAEVQRIEGEIGAQRTLRIVGRTKAGKAHALENVEVAVSGNPERIAVSLSGDVVQVTFNALAPELDSTNPDTGAVIPGIPPVEGDSSLSGAIAITADGRIGDGVRPIRKDFVCVAHVADATDLVLDDITPDEDFQAGVDQH